MVFTFLSSLTSHFDSFIHIQTHGLNFTVFYEPNKYNCHDLQTRRNGIYKFASNDEVSNDAGRFFYERYCDFATDGGAWTVIQRRYVNDQQENFNRSWLEYKLGFGELDKEFWFGNDFIHKLTFDEDVELRIILEDSTGRNVWAEYSMFKVDSEEYNYNLIIGGYRGTVPDGFLNHNDQEFSTYDRQNDNNNDSLPCATSYGNGWWFNKYILRVCMIPGTFFLPKSHYSCTEMSNVNYKGINWEDWLGSNFFKSSKMMVRPKGLWAGEDTNEYIYTTTTGTNP